MEKDRMALLRELSAHIGRPDFAEIAERITREMQATESVRPGPRVAGAPRPPARLARRA